MADTIAWALEYINRKMVGDRVLPEGHPELAVPAAPSLGWSTYPHIVLCAQCDVECDTACGICGGGLHDFPCTDHHGIDCEGDDHWGWYVGDGSAFLP